MFYLSVYVYEIMCTPVINSQYKTYIKFNGEVLNEALNILCSLLYSTLNIYSSLHLQFWSMHNTHIPSTLTPYILSSKHQ